MRVFTFVFIYLILSRLSGQEVYQIDPFYPVHDINKSLWVVKEGAKPFTQEDILNDTTIGYQAGDELPRYLEFKTVYWGKIKLLALDSLTGWTLHFQDYMIGLPAWGKSNGKVDVYAYQGEELIFQKKSGVEYPKEERDIKEKWTLNRVTIDDLPIGEVVTLVIRVEGNSIGYPAFFKLSLRGPSQPYYHELFQPNRSFNVFMFGVAFIILLYHFLLFIFLRQRVFLWFSIWLLFCTLTMAMSAGHFIGSFQSIRYPIWMSIANGIFIPFWFFGREFVSTAKKYPILDKVILGLCGAILFEIIITAIYVIAADPVIRLTSVGLHYPFLLLFNLIGFVLAVVLLVKKDAYARYFGTGVMIGNVAFFTGLLWAMSLIRINFDPFAWSLFLQIIIYSFGIAYRRQKLDEQAAQERLLAEKSSAEVQRIKDLDEVKSKFFANISHEFRTPLALITGPLDHAFRHSKQNGGGNGTIQLTSRNFDIIKNNTNRLENLIDQLLEISKIESGQIRLILSQGSLVKFVKSIVASFESLAESRNISLNTSFPKDKADVFYDKDKLEKILGNLLSNAFKYTKDGGTVSLGMRFEEDHFTLEISDTGKGIKQSELNKIFDRFYRVEGSEIEGSGIGLALSKELIDLQNGQINVRSTVGQGTTFRVRIPCSIVHLPKNISVFSDESSQPVISKIQEPGGLGVVEEVKGNTKDINSADLPEILIVEDNKDLREFISSILSRNYKVLLAQDGLQGERMAYEHVPDLIISDVMMPGKDGYELCNSLKSNVKTSHIPIIMLTAKAGQTNKLEGLTMGADAYLTKPFDEEELLIRMKNLLEARRKLWDHFKSLDLSIIPEMDLVSAEDKFLQQVVQEIKKNLDNDRFSVEDLARAVGFSRSQLHRKLKALIDKSAIQLISSIRLKEAFRMLQNKVGSVSEIAYSVGYNNMSYFTKSFKEEFGVLPSKVPEMKG